MHTLVRGNVAQASRAYPGCFNMVVWLSSLTHEAGSLPLLSQAVVVNCSHHENSYCCAGCWICTTLPKGGWHCAQQSLCIAVFLLRPFFGFFASPESRSARVTHEVLITRRVGPIPSASMLHSSRILGRTIATNRCYIGSLARAVGSSLRDAQSRQMTNAHPNKPTMMQVSTWLLNASGQINS